MTRPKTQQREALRQTKLTRPRSMEQDSPESELWAEYDTVLDEIDQLEGILDEIEHDLGRR